MAKESAGEWKLIKAWECKKCKLLIKDGRQVFDHKCSLSDKEDELLRLRKIIENQDQTIAEQKVIVENRDKVVDSKKEKIDGLENFIKELNESIESKDNDIKIKEQIIEDQKVIIDNNKKTIINQEMTIEEQKKNQNKVVEKIVYLEKNAPKIDKGENVENINVDIWQRDYRIKDSKDEGYREEIEFEIFERGKGREKLIIKNGKVVKKPDDIIVIGKHSPEGFIVKGIYRN